jgi:hypothetical protein
MISGSITDPYVNTGLPTGGALVLYLWYLADWQDGLSAAEFDLTGSIQVDSFLALNGFLNTGGATNLLLAVGGCPRGPLVAGQILAEDIAGGELCLGPSSANGDNVSVDCGSAGFMRHANLWTGYSSLGGNPCTNMPDPYVCWVSVEGASWGGVKALYR